jgi:hypothetical protein
LRGTPQIIFSYAYLLNAFLDLNDPSKLENQTRRLGLVVCRGTQINLICPTDGMEEIANPFEEESDANV